MLEVRPAKVYDIGPSSTEDMRPAGTYYCPECKNVVIRWNAPVKRFKLNCPKCNGDLQLVENEATVELFKLLGHEVKEYSKVSLGEYKKRGLKPPNGKGIHTRKFHEVSAAVMKKGNVKDRSHAHAIAMKQLGKKKAVKKSHQQFKGSAGPRRLGKPRTETERKKRHKKLHLGTKLPTRGTGLDIKTNKQGHSMLPPYKPFSAQTIAALHYGIKKAIGGWKRAYSGWKIGYRDGILEAEGKKTPPGAIKLAGLQDLHGNSYILGRQHALARAGMHGGTRGDQSWADMLTDLMHEISPEDK